MSEQKDVLLEVSHLKKYFKTNAGLLHAVDDVSFTVERGKTLWANPVVENPPPAEPSCG